MIYIGSRRIKITIRYLRGQTVKEIGGNFGIGPQRCHQLIGETIQQAMPDIVIDNKEARKYAPEIIQGIFNLIQIERSSHVWHDPLEKYRNKSRFLPIIL